jgi:hypothetical protein
MYNSIYKIFALFVLINLFSCYPNGKPKENPEQIDLPQMREDLGGAPSEMSTQGRSSFHSQPNCLSGFGLCNPILDQPNQDNQQLQDNKEPRKYSATFYLSPKDSILRIEFNEEIPHFASRFDVGRSDTIFNALGYKYIIPIEGRYSTFNDKTTVGTNGAVKIKVVKGPADSSFQ